MKKYNILHLCDIHFIFSLTIWVNIFYNLLLVLAMTHSNQLHISSKADKQLKCIQKQFCLSVNFFLIIVISTCQQIFQLIEFFKKVTVPAVITYTVVVQVIQVVLQWKVIRHTDFFSQYSLKDGLLYSQILNIQPTVTKQSLLFMPFCKKVTQFMLFV